MTGKLVKYGPIAVSGTALATSIYSIYYTHSTTSEIKQLQKSHQQKVVEIAEETARLDSQQTAMLRVVDETRQTAGDAQKRIEALERLVYEQREMIDSLGGIVRTIGYDWPYLRSSANRTIREERSDSRPSAYSREPSRYDSREAPRYDSREAPRYDSREPPRYDSREPPRYEYGTAAGASRSESAPRAAYNPPPPAKSDASAAQDILNRLRSPQAVPQ